MILSQVTYLAAVSMPKIYFIEHGFAFRHKRINAFSQRHQIYGRGSVALANQYSLPINSVYEDLPIILREVGTASPYLKD